MGFVVGLAILAACMLAGAGSLLALGLGLQALDLAPDVESWLWLLALPLLTASSWAVMAVTARLRR